MPPLARCLAQLSSTQSEKVSNRGAWVPWHGDLTAVVDLMAARRIAPYVFAINHLRISFDMDETVVRCICAIGQSGQLGLNGVLPWEGNHGRPFQEDVARFFEITKGHVLLAGPRTIASVPQFAFKDRTIAVIRSAMKPDDVLAQYRGRVIFIGGGPPVWEVYARYIQHWDVTRLPYDGPADRWFNPDWLVASGSDGAKHSAI